MARKTRGDGWEVIPANRSKKTPARTSSDAPGAQRIKIREETRNRGKRVTVASGFRLTAGDLKSLAKTLKSGCGAGGKQDAKTGTIEVQGAVGEKLAELLEAEGYVVA